MIYYVAYSGYCFKVLSVRFVTIESIAANFGFPGAEVSANSPRL